MAEVKISELSNGSALTGTEVVPIVQGGATVKVTAQEIADLGGGGGGGGGGFHVALKPVSGRAVSYNVVTSGITSSNFTANRLILVPFIPLNSLTISSLSMNCGAGAAGSLCRLLIYSDNNGLPNAKLYESVDIDLSTGGVKTITTSFTFNAGTTYWLAFHGNATPSSITHIQATSLVMIGNAGATPSFGSFYFVSVNLGSAPANITSPSLVSGSAPWINLTPA